MTCQGRNTSWKESRRPQSLWYCQLMTSATKIIWSEFWASLQLAAKDFWQTKLTVAWPGSSFNSNALDHCTRHWLIMRWHKCRISVKMASQLPLERNRSKDWLTLVQELACRLPRLFQTWSSWSFPNWQMLNVLVIGCGLLNYLAKELRWLTPARRCVKWCRNWTLPLMVEKIPFQWLHE